MIKSRMSVKRFFRHSLGFKMPRGFGILTNPKKALYNRIYNRTSFSIARLFKPSKDEGELAIGIMKLILIAGVGGIVVGFISTYWIEMLIVIAIILGLVIAFFIFRSSKPSIDRSLRRSQKLLDANKYKEVIDLLTPFSKEYNINVFNQLAFANAGLNNTKSAIKYLEQIYLNTSKEDNIRYFFGNKLSAMLLIDNQIDEAEKIFKDFSYRKRKFNSDTMNIGLNLAKILLNNNRIEEAHIVLKRLKKANIENDQSPATPMTNIEIKREVDQILFETSH